MPAPGRPLELLYDAVALGMWAYTRTAFRVVDLGTEGYRPRRGLLLVSTHRAESDVPLICPSIYIEGRYWDRAQPRIHFAARDDMFDPGFFGGFPPNLPLLARKLLARLEVGQVLPRVRVHPVPYPSASMLRLGRALAAVPPETALADVLARDLLDPFEARAQRLRTGPPSTAGDALTGAFSDLLWRFCTPEELASAAFEVAWKQRTEEATAAVRAVIELVASGEMLLLFPEGRPSPDGAIGPLRRGLGTIVRRGRPEAVTPVAISYDPIRRGRPWAFVAFGSELATGAEGIEETVLDALRRTTPLTCGQVVAHELCRCAEEGIRTLDVRALDSRLAAECELAAASSRPVEPDLLDTSKRAVRLTEALGWCIRAGLATAVDQRTIEAVPSRVASNAVLRRSATEYTSARAV